MALVMTPDQKVALSIAPTDKFGNAAKVDSIVWTSSDEAVITITVAEDGLSAEAFTTGAVGTAQVLVKADADLGEGVVELMGALDIEVVAGQAINLGVVAGTPESRE